MYVVFIHGEMSHALAVSGTHHEIIDGMQKTPISLEPRPLELILEAMKASRSDVQARVIAFCH